MKNYSNDGIKDNLIYNKSFLNNGITFHGKVKKKEKYCCLTVVNK